MKIGKANDPQKRLTKEIQPFSPTRLQLLAATPGGRPLEAKLHRDYRMHRLQGEWFDLPVEKLARLKQWMDDRPDWQWALLTRGKEMKELVREISNKCWVHKSFPKTTQERLRQRLSDLGRPVISLGSVMKHYLLPSLAEIDRCANLMLGDTPAQKFFSTEEREWFGRTVSRLRELAVSLSQIIEGQLPARLLNPPAPMPRATVV